MEIESSAAAVLISESKNEGYLVTEYADCKEVGGDDELNKLGVDEGDVHPSKVKQVSIVLPQCQHVPEKGKVQNGREGKRNHVSAYFCLLMHSVVEVDVGNQSFLPGSS